MWSLHPDEFKQVFLLLFSCSHFLGVFEGEIDGKHPCLEIPKPYITRGGFGQRFFSSCPDAAPGGCQAGNATNVEPSIYTPWTIPYPAGPKMLDVPF